MFLEFPHVCVVNRSRCLVTHVLYMCVPSPVAGLIKEQGTRSGALSYLPRQMLRSAFICVWLWSHLTPPSTNERHPRKSRMGTVRRPLYAATNL